jgi:hypothetical protein
VGARFKFQCPDCEYEAVVSGGEDVGFTFYTTTILCEVCEELDDVVTHTAPPAPEEAKAITPECPENGDHTLREWRYPGPCPKCGTLMEERGLALHWD